MKPRCQKYSKPLKDGLKIGQTIQSGRKDQVLVLFCRTIGKYPSIELSVRGDNLSPSTQSRVCSTRGFIRREQNEKLGRRETFPCFVFSLKTQTKNLLSQDLPGILLRELTKSDWVVAQSGFSTFPECSQKRKKRGKMKILLKLEKVLR